MSRTTSSVVAGSYPRPPSVRFKDLLLEQDKSLSTCVKLLL